MAYVMKFSTCKYFHVFSTLFFFIMCPNCCSTLVKYVYVEGNCKLTGKYHWLVRNFDIYSMVVLTLAVTCVENLNMCP